MYIYMRVYLFLTEPNPSNRSVELRTEYSGATFYIFSVGDYLHICTLFEFNWYRLTYIITVYYSMPSFLQCYFAISAFISTVIIPTDLMQYIQYIYSTMCIAPTSLTIFFFLCHNLASNLHGFARLNFKFTWHNIILAGNWENPLAKHCTSCAQLKFSRI